MVTVAINTTPHKHYNVRVTRIDGEYADIPVVAIDWETAKKIAIREATVNEQTYFDCFQSHMYIEPMDDDEEAALVEGTEVEGPMDLLEREVKAGRHWPSGGGGM